jgi:AsmA-like C-terminal region
MYQTKLVKKFLKYFLRGLLIFLAILVVLYITAIVYVTTHKKSIIAQITSEAGKRLSGQVTIKNVDLSFFKTFPKISVALQQIQITDSMYNNHHHAFFSAADVLVRLSVIKLYKHEFPVDGIKIINGASYVFTDSTGYTNRYLLKPKNSSTGEVKKRSSSSENGLSSIILNDFTLTIKDDMKGKLQDIMVSGLNVKLTDTGSSVLLTAKTRLLVHDLTFNSRRGSFIKEKRFEGDFDLRFDKTARQLQFDSIDVKIGGHPFNLTGRFDLEGNDPQFALRIHTKNIHYDFAKSLLTPKIDSAVSIVSLSKEFNVDAILYGPLKTGDPFIYINWDVKNSHMTTPFLDFDEATFTGYFTNQRNTQQSGTDANSILNLGRFSAKWNGLPITATQIDIVNFDHPVLNGDLHSSFPLTRLNDMLESNTIRLNAGTGTVNLTYSGPLTNNTHFNSFVNGAITFSDGNILYLPRNVEMKNVAGKLELKNSDVSVQNLQCVVLNNKIVMNGQANNLITLMNTEPNKANINWNIYSPSLNLSSFIYLLKPPEKQKVTVTNKRKLRRVAGNLDAVLEQGIVNVHLRADNLLYKNFTATAVAADLSLLQDRYLIRNVTMQHGGGSMSLNGELVNRKTNFHEAVVHAALTNVNVRKVFTAFDNFGQDGLQAQNIEGTLNANVQATMGLNDDGKVYPGSVAGDVDFSLKNGALVNFAPIMKLQGFLFKNRDFSNIRFAELKDRFEIANEQIKINRMEIESTVLTAFVEGIYSRKGNTDISIQLPLSNLKKRDAAYIPVNIGVDKNAGRSLFVRGRPGPDGKVQFKADLFNRYAKENK